MKRKFAFILMVVMLMGACMPVAFAAEEQRQWQAMPVPGGAKYGMMLVGVEDKLYALGGSGSTTNWLYNKETNKWSECAPMPVQDYCGACAVGNKIYVFYRNPAKGAFIYDTVNDEWTEGTPLPKDIDSIKVFTNQKQICVVGQQGDYFIFDLNSKSWVKEGKLPVIPNDSSICSDLKYIYVIGGENHAMISAYNINMNTYSDLAPMSAQRRGSSTILHNGKIYIAAGYNFIIPIQSLVRTQSVEVFDIKSKTWTLEPELSSVYPDWITYGASDKIYAIGMNSNKLQIIHYLDVGPAAPEASEKLSVLLNVGEAAQLSVSQNLADNAALIWSSTNEAVAAVDASGKVTATGEGAADIFAANEDGTFRESIPVRVFPGTADEYRLALHLNQGATSRLYLTDDPAAATWSSADSTVATVSQSGTVTATGRGLAIITATLDSKPYQIYVRVGA